MGQWVAFMDVAFDIFDDDRAVVDQDADGQRKAAQRHGVEGLPINEDDQNGGDDGERNRRQNDQRQTPVS
jgi:hypothetical protein